MYASLAVARAEANLATPRSRRDPAEAGLVAERRWREERGGRGSPPPPPLSSEAVPWIVALDQSLLPLLRQWLQ